MKKYFQSVLFEPFKYKNTEDFMIGIAGWLIYILVLGGIIAALHHFLPKSWY